MKIWWWQPLTLATTVLTGLGTSALAEGFFDGLAGEWRGAGSAYVAPLGDITARCRLSITSVGDGVRMEGVCRKGLIRRNLSLRLDSSDGKTFTGSYDGTRADAALLSGTANGGTLRLAIHWPKAVNGDRNAQLVLSKGGSVLSQVVTDQVNGVPRDTSSFTFRRR